MIFGSFNRQAKVDNSHRINKLTKLEIKKMEEITKIKAEIFDIIQQQEECVAATNVLQETKNQKLQQLKDTKLSPDEIIIMKAEIFDIIQKQEEYIAKANNLQQNRIEKMQKLK